MDAMTQFCNAIVSVIDVPLGWLLELPRDLTLLIFAFLTALLMTVARRYVTNQDLLKCCSQDLRRLKELARDARRASDSQKTLRLRGTTSLVQQHRLAADMRVLGVVLLPMAALAIWASERLDYLPARVGDDVVLRAIFPLSSTDDVTHLVPVEGIELRGSAIQLIRAEQTSPPQAIAEWTLHPTRPLGEVALTIRHHGQSVVHPVIFGSTRYRPPQQVHSHERLVRTDVGLIRYYPLGVDLKSEALGLAPWIVGYLALTLLLVPLLKRLLKVA